MGPHNYVSIHVYNSNNHDSSEFVKLLEAFDYTQYVSGPTHNRRPTLDLVIGEGLNITTDSIKDISVSDHFCIFFNALFTPPNTNQNADSKKKNYI